jgi:hypothetical protein
VLAEAGAFRTRSEAAVAKPLGKAVNAENHRHIRDNAKTFFTEKNQASRKSFQPSASAWHARSYSNYSFS